MLDASDCILSGMNHKILLIFFFLIFPSLSFSIENNPQNSIISINENWEYTNGFNIKWIKNPEKYNVWLKWHSVDLPYHPDTLDSESAWITFRKEIPMELIEMSKTGKSIAIDLGLISDVNMHYINDQKIAQMGNVKPYQSALYMRSFFELPLQKYLKKNQKNYYYIVLYSKHYHPINIFGPEFLAGYPNDIYLRFYIKDFIKGIFLGIYLFVGFYHLLLFFRRRKDHYNLFFGLFALFFGILGIFYLSYRDLIFGNHVYLRLYLQHFLLYLTVPFLLLFAARFFAQRYTLLSIVYSILSITLWTVEFIGPYYFQNITLKIFYLMALPAFIYILYVIIRAAIHKNTAAYYIGGGIILLVLAAANDILRDLEIIPTPKLADYAFLFFVMGIAGILAARFVRIHNEVEELNINLENKVKERTSELNESLQRVEALKNRQDGDYFLTSLLTSPLSKAPENQKKIIAEFYIEEYKKFQFRKWKRDIGGDICISDHIILNNREYTFFTNADAMGKSMQGAGGVIIYGSLIHAWLDRVKMNPKEANTFPERWIKNLFIELHKTFSTFDGSMLMSTIIGLIDESNGNVFFINAEHPWLILYRDKKASFIEKELKLHKLGTPGVDNKITINTFQMEPGDSLFLGSDGKDDIILQDNDNQTNILNEDENLILNFIDEQNGDLSKIVHSIKRKATLKDDLSIMKITWEMQIPDINEYQDKISRTEKSSSEILNFINKKEYTKAYHILDAWIESGEKIPLSILEDICQKSILSAFTEKNISLLLKYSEYFYNQNPLSDFAAYYYVLSLKTARKFIKAIDHSERIRIRNPHHLKNLIILSDLHRIAKDYERSRKILAEAKTLDPQNKNILKLQQLLDEL